MVCDNILVQKREREELGVVERERKRKIMDAKEQGDKREGKEGKTKKL